MRLSTSTFWVLAAILNAFEGALIFMFFAADEGDHVIWGPEEIDWRVNKLASLLFPLLLSSFLSFSRLSQHVLYAHENGVIVTQSRSTDFYQNHS